MNTEQNKYWENVWSKKDLFLISLFILLVFAPFVVIALLINTELVFRMMIINLGSFFAITSVIFTYSKRKGVNIKEFVFKTPGFKWMFIAVLIALGVVIIGGGLSSAFSKLLNLESSDSGLINTVSSGKLWLDLINLKLIVGILIPFAEELFFRGLIFRYLRQKNSFVMSALLSSLIFTLAHLDPTSIFFTFLLGFSSAWVLEKTKSLIPSFLIHMGANTLAINLLLLSIF
ncbi:MAG: hypothetical protein Athens071416_84 [Parcubacteria group bacterium Athens0714_16]|nr:MAG: hypothetical protein Athens071416_84 [Parcubacteria group bacterium Athens0714_16]